MVISEHTQKNIDTYLADETVNTIIATSDGAIYINNDVNTMRSYCESKKLEMQVLKETHTVANKTESTDEDLEDFKPKKNKK